MATVKPTKPTETLPSAFATEETAVKTDYTAEELSAGYQDGIPQILDGGNLNYLINAMFKYLTYNTAFSDWLAGATSGKCPYVNSSNQLDYATPVFGDQDNTFSGDNSFTGTITATTQATSDNSTKVATTAFVRSYMSSVLGSIYPVGSVYIGTQSSCPMDNLISGSTWSLVSKGKALWTGNGQAGSGTTANADFANAKANTTIAAGAPNIKGTAKGDDFPPAMETSGAFYNAGNYSDTATGNAKTSKILGFEASRSNSIYGKSTTVQPPAYVVNVWRRTA